MDNHIRKVYVPMTETGFYILLCLRKEAHGYGIVKKTEQLTQGQIKISPGTLYGSKRNERSIALQSLGRKCLI